MAGKFGTLQAANREEKRIVSWQLSSVESKASERGTKLTALLLHVVLLRPHQARYKGVVQ